MKIQDFCNYTYNYSLKTVKNSFKALTSNKAGFVAGAIFSTINLINLNPPVFSNYFTLSEKTVLAINIVTASLFLAFLIKKISSLFAKIYFYFYPTLKDSPTHIELKNTVLEIGLLLNEQIEKQSLNDDQLKQIISLFDKIHPTVFTHHELFTEFLKEKLLKKFGAEKTAKILEQLKINKNFFQTQQEFESAIKTIVTQAERDLFLDEKSLDDKLALTEILKSFPEKIQKNKQQELKKIISQAYLNREIRQKNKITIGDANERKLLEFFKFNIDENSPYSNKEAIYQILEETVFVYLKKQDENHDLSYVKKILKEQLLETRLQVAGLNSLQIEKFKALHTFFHEFQKNLTDQYKKIELILPANFPHENCKLEKQNLKIHFEQYKKYYVDNELNHFFNNPKLHEVFSDDNYSAEKLNNFLKEKNRLYQLKETTIKKCQQSFNQDYKSDIDFYCQWGFAINKELIQGFEDENEVLNRGVCWATCQRIRSESQDNPNLTIEQLNKKVMILSSDRYQQINYQLKNHFNEQFTLPKYIENQGFQSKFLFKDVYDNDEHTLKQFIQKNKNDLPTSNGWLMLGLHMVEAGHAILIRWDELNNRYWLIDPNIGFLSFEDHFKENPKEKLLECFESIVINNYSTTHHLNINQLMR